MKMQFPNAMMSAFLVTGRAVTLTARPYRCLGDLNTLSLLEGESLRFVFHRSGDGRASLAFSKGSNVEIRVIVDVNSGSQYFVRDEQRAVLRMDAVSGWDWNEEYSRLSQESLPMRLIQGVQAHLAPSSKENAGVHELWVSLGRRIPIAEVVGCQESSIAIVVDDVREGEPEGDVFRWPSDYTVEYAGAERPGWGQ